jgi:hypothetical protein
MNIALEYLGDGIYRVEKEYKLEGVTVPKDFITDIDSVPRIPFIYTLYKNRAIPASILHDYLYSIKVNRELADLTYLRAMTTTGVPSFYKYPIYYAVRLFGWLFY